jgi:predicted DNA-binding transcriptional regulator YafY
VEIRYQSGRGEATERRIAPLEILIAHGKPAVEAFCHLRGEKRTFYLERIEDIRA